MRLPPFRIEEYYARHEFGTRYTLSSSDCESRPLGDLLALEPEAEERLRALWLGYTESPGAARPARGDRGAVRDRRPRRRRRRHGRRGGHLPAPPRAPRRRRPRRRRDAVLRVGAAARARHGRRGLRVAAPARGQHDALDRLPAAVDLGGVSLGSVSKTYGLPGLRLGWIACRDPRVRDAVVALKHYTTICAPAPGELLCELALRHRDAIAQRNRELVVRNLPLVDAFVARDPRFSWTRPTAGPVGFARVEVPDVDALCARLAAAGVLLLPGSVYDEPDHVRLGYGRASLPEALALLERLLA